MASRAAPILLCRVVRPNFAPHVGANIIGGHAMRRASVMPRACALPTPRLVRGIMSDQRSSSRSQSGLFNLPTGLPAGLVAVAGIFAAWYTHSARLDTPRPPAAEAPSAAYDREQDVPARLWQDPFQA